MKQNIQVTYDTSTSNARSECSIAINPDNPTVPADLGLCIVEVLNALEHGELELVRQFRDQELAATPLGRRLTELVQQHGAELAGCVAADSELRALAVSVLRRSVEFIRSARSAEPACLDREIIGDIDHLLDRVSGQSAGEPLAAPGGSVNAVAIGRAGGRDIIVSGHDDGTVWIWDAVTGHPIGEPLAVHGAPVNAVAIGRAGDTDIIVSGSSDRTVMVHEHRPAQDVNRLPAAAQPPQSPTPASR
jgi:hypothetical protein